MAFIYTSYGRHYLSGCAVTALKSIVLNKGLLHRVKIFTVCNTFDSSNFLSFLHNRKTQTGKHPFTIHMNCACSALSVITTFFSACKCQLFAEEIEKGYTWFDSEFKILAIYFEGKFNGLKKSRCFFIPL